MQPFQNFVMVKTIATTQLMKVHVQCVRIRGQMHVIVTKMIQTITLAQMEVCNVMMISVSN